jgi:hypothetical protein
MTVCTCRDVKSGSADHSYCCCKQHKENIAAGNDIDVGIAMRSGQAAYQYMEDQHTHSQGHQQGSICKTLYAQQAAHHSHKEVHTNKHLHAV